MTSRVLSRLAFTYVTLLLASGCNSQSDQPAPQTKSGEADHAAHEHPSTGPHGGDLIELGAEKFHAELLHETDATVYVLDSSARAVAPIDARELTINLTHDGKAEQFKLTASRDRDDPEGKSSRFTSNDAELLKDLQAGHAQGELVVSIDGKQYRGELVHDHDEGHAHHEGEHDN
jgi:hypothetical protein